MKGSCTLIASALAASTAALRPSSAADERDASSGAAASSERDSPSSRSHETASSSGKVKFAPRFDGLRFIETLVTAHR